MSDKQVLIKESLLCDVYKLISCLNGSISIDKDKFKEIVDNVEIELEYKIKAREKRNQFSTYKKLKNDEEREVARKKYLDTALINKDFRTSREVRDKK